MYECFLFSSEYTTPCRQERTISQRIRPFYIKPSGEVKAVERLASTIFYSSNQDEPADNIPPLKKNEKDETYSELSRKRRFTVCDWEGAVKVDIREFYERDGKLLPGKKGISLTLDQYKIMKNLIEDGTVDEIISDLEGDIKGKNY